MREELVSIVIPIYNSSKYLEQCVRSVLQQSYKEIQVILVNDGSTDNSLEICKDIATEDTRVIVISKENSGVSDARNKGIAAARGRFLMFVDADDYVMQHHVEQYVRAWEEGIDGIFGIHSYDYEGKTFARSMRLPAGNYTYDQLKDKLIDDGTLTGILFGSVCGCLYLTEKVQSNDIFFDNTVRRNEDGIFNIKYISNSARIAVTEFASYVYRQDVKRTTQILPQSQFLDSDDAIEKYYATKDPDFLDDTNYQRQMEARQLSVLFWIILSCVESDMTFEEKHGFVKTELKKVSREQYDSLNMRAISKYKKIIAIAMKHSWSLFFVVGIGVIFKHFKSWIKR